MNQVILSQQQKIHLTANMQRYGGNFVTCIANAMIAADPDNFSRLCEAFPDLVEKYMNWPTPQNQEIK
jgi:hypothetical protein